MDCLHETETNSGTSSGETRQNQKWPIFLAIFTITLLWGMAWVMMKIGLQYMGPFTFSALRFVSGSIVLLILLLYFKPTAPTKSEIKHLVIVGFLQTTTVFSLVMIGLQFVNAGKSSVLLYSMPVWSGILASIFLQEKLTKNKIIGLISGGAGLVLMIGLDVFHGQTTNTLIGEFFIIIAAIIWALASVYFRRYLVSMKQLEVAAYQMSIGAVGLVAAAFLFEGGMIVNWSAQALFTVLFTGVFASALCFWLWYFVLARVDTLTATMSTLLVPVFALFFGYLFLDEQIGWGVVCGAGLIFFGIYLVQGKQREKMRRKER